MKTEEQTLSEGTSVTSESPTRDSRGTSVEPDEERGAPPAPENGGSSAVIRGKPPRNWLPLANILALLTVLMATVPATLSLYNWVVDSALVIVDTGVYEFQADRAWGPSESIEGWNESKKRIRFKSPVPCPQPEIRVSISSVDFGGASRLDVAAPAEERTRDGFQLVARTWGGSKKIPWVKVDWFVACPREAGVVQDKPLPNWLIAMWNWLTPTNVLGLLTVLLILFILLAAPEILSFYDSWKRKAADKKPRSYSPR